MRVVKVFQNDNTLLAAGLTRHLFFHNEARMKEADFRVLLQNELARRCQANPAYSLRAYARSLGTDVGNLSKILAKKRSVGKNTIQKFAGKLGLGPQEIALYLSGAQSIANKAKQGVGAKLADPQFHQLTIDQFQMIAEWQHFSILELMRLDDFKPSPSWVAKRLGISLHEVNASIERLQRLEILEVTRDGKWIDRIDGKSTSLPNPHSSTAHRKLQQKFLEQASEALDRYPIDIRDQSTMTMAIDTGKIRIAKEEIKRFRRKMAKLLSRDQKHDEIYNLSISFFPVTQTKKQVTKHTERKKNT